MQVKDKSFYYYNYPHSDIEWGTELSFPNTRNIKQYTHKIFNRYPARSISLVPRAVIFEAFAKKNEKEKLKILDPFMGSGTTAIEAVLQGAIPYGVELDPFARLISDVSTKGITQNGVSRILKSFEEIKKKWQVFPPEISLKPKLRNIEIWFEDKEFFDLLKIKNAIYNIIEPEDLPFFKVVLADMIRPCSKAERQSLKPYISKKHIKIPTSVEEQFNKSFTKHYDSVLEYSEAIGYSQHEINWLGNDATRFSGCNSLDLAITSPPYINALDYIRCVKLESTWVDCSDDKSLIEQRNHQIGDLRKNNIDKSILGDGQIYEYYKMIKEIDSLRADVIYKYFLDMYNNMLSVKNLLKENGSYVIIVGNSRIRGIDVPTHQLLAEIAEKLGMVWKNYYNYSIKDHRLSIPRKNNGDKINIEHVMTFTK